jgi:hypothetical protein
MRAIREAISKATSLEEVERLNRLLQAGQIPGRIPQATPAGWCSFEFFNKICQLVAGTKSYLEDFIVSADRVQQEEMEEEEEEEEEEAVNGH